MGVAVAVWLCAAAAPAGSPGGPARARAFIGEGLVINPVTEALTEGAEKVLEQGSRVPEIVQEAGEAGGDEGAGEAAGVLESGGLLPSLGGSVISFGAGTVIGSEICHVAGIEGCWYFRTDGADPVPTKGEWVWRTKGLAIPAGQTSYVPAYSWRWKWTEGLSGEEERYLGYFGADALSGECHGNNAEKPESATTVRPSSVVPGCAGRLWNSIAIRSGMANRSLEYHATDDPEIGNYSYTAPAEWPKSMATAIKTQHQPGEEVGQWIGHQLAPSEVANPYANLTVPSCEGLSASACVELLEEVGLTPSVAYLDWGSAVIPEPNLEEPILSLEAQAEKVQKLSPSSGTKMVAGEKVTVTANPKLGGMPLIVPEDPAPGESADAYRERRLAPQAPGWTVKPEVLGEANEDTEYDPGMVVRPVAKPGTRLNPETTPETAVQVNPSTSPPVPPGGGSSCGAGIGAIDWSPLNQPLGSKFPFGIFGFFVTWIGEWELGEGTPPHWSVTFVPAGVFGSKGLETEINLGFMSPVIGATRDVFLFASFVGLLWFLGTAAAKLQGDDS